METFEEVTYQERMALAALDYLEYRFSDRSHARWGDQ